MSGSHKLLSLNESLGSLRSDTSFPFAHFVPWRHHTRSKIKVGRTNMCLDRNFPPATNTREEDHSSERQLHLFGSQRANHLDLTVDGGARIDSQSLGGFWQKLDRRGARTRKIIIKINISGVRALPRRWWNFCRKPPTFGGPSMPRLQHLRVVILKGEVVLRCHDLLSCIPSLRNKSCPCISSFVRN